MTVPIATRRSNDVVAADILDLCSRLCSWTEAPATWCGGRAAWHPLEGALAGGAGGAALKLKGLGVAPSGGEPARLPDTIAYDRWPGQEADPHFGIGADREFALVEGDPAPLGGLTLVNALREFDCATALAAHRVPAVRAVTVYEYSGQAMRHGTVCLPLGVSITASPLAGPARCSVALPGLGDDAAGHDELRRLASALELGTIEETSVADRLRVLGAVYRGFGTTLRAFAAAGWFRYSGHPDNVVVDDAGDVVLVDLDSCRAMEPARMDVAALEAVRDGMSALYNLACSFFRPLVLAAACDEDLIAHEPFSMFLDGWDPETAGANRSTGRAIARYVVAARARLRHFEPFLSAPTPAGQHLYRFVRHDRDLTFSWLYRIVFARRLQRPHAYALPFDRAALDDRLLRFAGRERFERMAALDIALRSDGV
jgi:hypothetical protein